MSGGLGALSLAWVAAEASMPLGWRLMALVRQPDSDDWQATAAGPLEARPCMAVELSLSRRCAAKPTSCGASAGR